jgi:hypothetical protein
LSHGGLALPRPGGDSFAGMADITVTGGDGRFVVAVSGPGAATSHTVTVPPGFARGLGWDDDEPLVRASFAFLLEREPATSILGRFSLEVIERYFPAYRSEIARHPGRP